MTDTHDTSSRNPAVILAVGLALGLPADLLRAFVLTQLWQWFVAPYGLAAPSLLHAYGLIVLFSFLRGRSDQSNKAATLMRLLQLVVNSVIASLMAWGIGALIFTVLA